MSRIAKKPISVPSGVTITSSENAVSVKGPKGELSMQMHADVVMSQEASELSFAPVAETKSANALAGTMRSVISNMVVGVTNGFERKLNLVGVGYRAQAQGSKLNLTLGFSHPIEYELPKGITAETPSQTEIVIRGIDKQVVGQVASEIRAFRPPEPYKGKGVRYSDEQVARKEAKKK